MTRPTPKVLKIAAAIEKMAGRYKSRAEFQRGVSRWLNQEREKNKLLREKKQAEERLANLEKKIHRRAL